MVGVVLENRHNKDEPIKCLQSKNRGNLGALRGDFVIRLDGSRVQDAFFLWMRIDGTQRILNDHPPCPTARPILEHSISVYSILQASDEAFFSLLVITGQQQREQVQAAHIFVEDLAKICRGGVFGVFRVHDLITIPHQTLRHNAMIPVTVINMSRNLLPLLRASCLSTYFVRTPPQENFAPSLISS